MLRSIFNHAVEFSKLARSFGFREGGAAYYAASFAYKGPTAGKPRLRQIRVEGVPHPIFYRIGTSDWPVFKKVFLDKEYDITSKPHAAALKQFYAGLLSTSKQPVIIDCGANIGLASVWYANSFPHARIYAIEPEPDNFAILVKNCSVYENIVPVRAAVSDNETKVSLRNVSDEPWAWETKESETGTVPTVIIPNLVLQEANATLFIVKIDIEGFEVELFRSNIEWVSQTPLVVYEPHDWLFPWRGTAHAMLSVLSEQRRDYLQRGENTFAFSHSLINRV